MKKKSCKRCGHAFEEHASDRNHPDTQPCWAGACTGDGCMLQCKDYIDPEEGQ